MTYLLLSLLFILGAIVGSFLNVVILRLPREQSLKGRSHCPSCGHQLSALELVPFFSFIFLRGKCRACGKKISWRYFGIELLTGLLFLFAGTQAMFFTSLGLLDLARNLFVIGIFIVVFMVDWEHYIILDSVLITGFIGVSLANLVLDLAGSGNFFTLNGYFLNGLMGALIAALPFFVIWFFSKGAWMGFGDVKLALFLGVVFGWPLLAINLFIAVILGGAASIFLLLLQKKTLKSIIPFGTFLSLAGVVTLFYGHKLLAWYLAILGF